MSETGLAAVVREYNAPMEIVEYPVPDPEPGALTVAVDVASVCGTDVHGWQGQYAGVLPIELPLILGHEVVGRITAIGDGADVDSLGQPLAVGDRVVWTHEPCGRCWACAIDNEPTLCPTRRIGMFSSSAVFPHFSGTFAQYSYVWPKAGRLRVPDDVESRWASAASCALRTVVNAVERAGWVDYMDNVVVQGAGPVGLFATALLAAHSPRTLVVVGAPDDRLDVARQYGATHTISIEEHPDAADRLALVKELTQGRGASVAIEASGAPGVVSEGVEMIAPNGRYVLVGSVGAPAQPILAHRIINRGLTVIGSFGGNIDSYYKALEFMRHNASRFDWNLVIGNDYRLDQIDEAIANMQAFRDIKPVITPFAT
jgi:L-iditol 2-dehydrogenase